MRGLVSTSFDMLSCKPCRGRKSTNNNHIVFVETIIPNVSEIFLECLSSCFSKYSLPLEITTSENHLGLHFIEKETLAQVFCCEFCEICQNTLLHRTRLMAASDHCFNLLLTISDYLAK